MVVGEVATSTDVLVIGAGPGGYVAALRAAQRGMQVTLVDRGALGGVCLNVGCIPSKALIHAADIAALSGRHAGIDITTSVDIDEVQAHVAAVVTAGTDGVATLLDAAGVTVVAGNARFSRPGRVAVHSGDQVTHHEFGHCILATGSRPVELDALPTDGVTVVDSTGALFLDRVPATMAIVGAGYIGVELGTAWAKLGASVTLVEAEDRILPATDATAARVIARRLDDLGVAVRTSSRALRAEGGMLTVADADGTETGVDAEVTVVAVGRVPNTDDLGLALAGIEVGADGRIDVAPDRRATRAILAIGDITPGPALAHKATAEAEVAVAAIAGESVAFDPAAIAEVVFSDPEIASVGLTAAAARDTGVEVQRFRFPFTAGSRSRTLDDTAGFVELTADDAGTVVGGLLVGAGVSELVGQVSLAIEMAATVEDVAATIQAHPTQSEAIAEAAHGLAGEPLHVHRGPVRSRQG